MTFFARQQAARQQTSRLLILYAFAVAAVIGSVHLLVSKIVTHGTSWFDFETFPVSCGGTLLVILIGVAVGKARFSGGGSAVAEMCGGQPIEPGTLEPAERRLLNIVEEMSIASGVPMPSLFVLASEKGINAFAAGHTTGDFAVAVSRGCLEQLNRDELQGVVAHEFSHILNGDMRRNLNLTGWLYGISGITLIGRVLFEIAGRSGSSRNNKEKGGSVAALFILGLGLVIIGWIGQLFARAIQAAISRQREHLADASAVQFTRNPEGIANALKKIAGFSSGSIVTNPEAAPVAHMFFACALNSFFATHPPIEERIRLLDPHFNPEIAQLISDGTLPSSPVGTSAFAEASPSELTRSLPRPSEIASMVGHLGAAQLKLAATLLARLPAPLTAATLDPLSASALVYGLLLHPDPQIQAGQMERLQRTAQPDCQRELTLLIPHLTSLPRPDRLPLVHLATASLRHLSSAQYTQFRHDVDALIEADNSVDLFEYALQKNLRRHLDIHFRRTERPTLRRIPPNLLLSNGAILISCLAHLGTHDPLSQSAAFDAGMARLSESATGLQLLPLAQCNLDQVDTVLDQFVLASLPIKQRILDACAHTVASDNFIQDTEAELLRAIADSLDCPLPTQLFRAVGDSTAD